MGGGTLLGVTILLVELVSDTRCPEQATRPIAGAVAIRLELRTGADSMTTELWTVRDRREVTISGRRITLIDVLPHPRIDRSTDPTSYVARRTVEQ